MNDSDDREYPAFGSAEHIAHRLGLPVAFLKAEAKAGRIPFIEAGGRRLFNFEQVRDELLLKATQSLPIRRQGEIKRAAKHPTERTQ